MPVGRVNKIIIKCSQCKSEGFLKSYRSCHAIAIKYILINQLLNSNYKPKISLFGEMFKIASFNCSF